MSAGGIRNNGGGAGHLHGLYDKISWWDLLLHGLSGLLCAITVFILIIRWGGAKLSPAGCMVIIAYILVMVCTGKIRNISIATWVIGVIFLATFLISSV